MIYTEYAGASETRFATERAISFCSSSTSTSSSAFCSSSAGLSASFFSPSSASPAFSPSFSTGVARSGLAVGSGDLLGLGLSSATSSEAGTFFVGTKIRTTALSFVLGSITVSTSRPSGNSALGASYSTTILFSTSTPFGTYTSLILGMSWSTL